jgi:hypothetical protein
VPVEVIVSADDDDFAVTAEQQIYRLFNRLAVQNPGGAFDGGGFEF